MDDTNIEIKVVELDKDRVSSLISRILPILHEYSIGEQMGALHLIQETYPGKYEVFSIDGNTNNDPRVHSGGS